MTPHVYGLIQIHVPYHAPAPDWHLHSSTSCLTVQHRLGGLISLHDVATGKRRQFKRRASSIELTTQSGDIYWHDMIMKLNWISCECTQSFVNDFHLHIWDKVRSMWVIQYTYCWLSISRNPWQKARVCICQRAADAVEIHLPGQWQVGTLLPHDSKRIIANHLHFLYEAVTNKNNFEIFKTTRVKIAHGIRERATFPSRNSDDLLMEAAENNTLVSLGSRSSRGGRWSARFTLLQPGKPRARVRSSRHCMGTLKLSCSADVVNVRYILNDRYVFEVPLLHPR